MPGRNDALSAIKEGATIKTFCDIDDAILRKVGAELAKAQGRDAGFEKDFRRVLEDKEIDALFHLMCEAKASRLATLLEAVYRSPRREIRVAPKEEGR